MITSDFLVIGSGIAGLNFALQAAKEGKVTLVTKKDVLESNTNFAQGGIAAVFSPGDSFDMHVNDTLKAGDGLCDREAVEIMVKQAPEEIERLMHLGAEFDQKGGKLELGKEGGHSRKRIVHRSDMTGSEIEKTMALAARGNQNIRIFEKHVALDLIMKNGRCIGARVFDNTNSKAVDFFAKVTALATGGLGRVYENTSNPDIATGDGVAMGFRAGCEIQDIEFVQFHPTALRRKGMPFLLISEALRGEGAKLKNSRGKRFINELEFRDVVARAIFSEMKKGRVYLDITGREPDFVKKRFQHIYKTCLENGIDITRHKIPVEPVAHYACGGVKTDTLGQTNIPGLYAFGEVACTGVHGANRLASNSLLESLVFSSRAAESAVGYAWDEKLETMNLPVVEINDAETYEIIIPLRSVMWKKAGIIRNGQGLTLALRKLDSLRKQLKAMAGDGINADIIEARNMLLASRLIVSAALLRKESRGGHFREDYPEKSENWERRLILRI